MNRTYGAMVALTVIGLMFALGVAAQDQKKELGPARAAPAQAASRVPGIPLLTLREQHAGLVTQWTVTEYGLFVLRPDQLLNYDLDLKLVKAVELPKISSFAVQQRPSEPADGEPGPARKAMRMARLTQWMAGLHNQMPTRLEVTASSIFISRGNHLLKYNHDLKLQKNVALPEAKPGGCPLCGQMMKHSMPGGHEVH